MIPRFPPSLPSITLARLSAGILPGATTSNSDSWSNTWCQRLPERGVILDQQDSGQIVPAVLSSQVFQRLLHLLS